MLFFNLDPNSPLYLIIGLTHYLGQDKDAEEMKSESKNFVFVAGNEMFIGHQSACSWMMHIHETFKIFLSLPTKTM